MIRFEGGLSLGETKDWMYDHGFKFTHDYHRPVVQKALPEGDNWLMNALIATGGLPPQNRQQQLVQGGLQIVGTAAMIRSAKSPLNRGVASAQPVFETRAALQVNINDFMNLKKVVPTVRVYRVEGRARNDRPERRSDDQRRRAMLFLNFGDSIRAQEFFATRLGQKMFGVRTKSFEVPRWFRQQLVQEAVP